MTVNIVNVRKDICDVYIGRDFGGWEGSKFANPFPAGKTDASRQEAINKYADWLRGEIRARRITWKELAALDGKRLGCWCSPKPCHGDVLAKFIKVAVKIADELVDS